MSTIHITRQVHLDNPVYVKITRAVASRRTLCSTEAGLQSSCTPRGTTAVSTTLGELAPTCLLMMLVSSDRRSVAEALATVRSVFQKGSKKTLGSNDQPLDASYTPAVFWPCMRITFTPRVDDSKLCSLL